MTPTPPPPAAVPTPTPTPGDGLVEFVRGKRDAAAYLLLGLSLVFLGLTIWFGVKGFRAAPKPAAADAAKADPFEPDDEAKAAAVTVDPRRNDFVVGTVGAVLAFLITVSGGVYLAVAVPKPTADGQRTDARVVILAVGGLLGLILLMIGVVNFYRWSDALSAWLNPPSPDKADVRQARWVVGPLLAIVAGAGLMFVATQPARAEERNNPTLRKLVYGTNLALGVLLLFIALVVANVIVSLKSPAKLDTTASGFYSMSPTTEEFLGNLPQPITAFAILPGSGQRMETDIRDLLTRFAEASKDKFQVKFLSASTNTADLAALKVDYPTVMDKGELGVLLTFPQDKKRFTFIPIDDFFDRQGGRAQPGQEPTLAFVGEGRVMRELKFLADNQQRPKVYFTQAAGEMTFGSPDTPDDRSLDRLRDYLDRNYLDPQPLPFDPSAAAAPKVPDDCAVLIVADPRRTLPAPAVEAVRRYMTDPLPDGKKGKLIVLAGAPAGRGKVNPTGLEAVLTGFNVTVGQQYLFSKSADLRVPEVLSQVGFTRAAAKAQNPIAKTLGRLSFGMYFPREVTAATTGGAPGMTATALLETESEVGAWTEDEMPTTGFNASITAAARSQRLYRAKAVGVVVAEGGTGRVAVYGNGTMVSDRLAAEYRSESPPEFDLIGATIDWLRDRPPVPSGVVSKTYSMYVFPKPKTVDTGRLYFLPLGLVGMAVLGVGLGVWVTRRK